jgi:stearoyl-CoA desaturase (delta-9 desaturase)
MYVVAALVFVSTYLLTIVWTSIGYHRGLTHGAVAFPPFVRRVIVSLGNWVTGIDPKAWVTMHRRHHLHSDTALDPHSPKNVGLWGIPREQLRSYDAVLNALRAHDPETEAVAPDVELSWPIRSGAWWAPYVLHVVVGVALAVVGFWPVGAAYIAGMFSHSAQGAIINALGHAHGGRNFDLDDNSRNNALAAWLILGEGYQNNHHRHPASARFSYRRSEVDLGYGLCRLLQAVGLLQIEQRTLMPRAPSTSLAATATTTTL